MMSDPKRIVAALLVGKKHEDESGNEDNDSPQAQEAAAQDVMDAIKSGDAKALAAALKDFMDVCEYDDQDESQ